MNRRIPPPAIARAQFPPPGFYQFLATLPEIRILLQRGWFASHWMTIIGTVMYMLTAIKVPGLSLVFYTIAVLGAIATYSIVIYQKHYMGREFLPSVVPLSQAVRSENFHLLLLALLWLITPAQLFKILPFYIYLLLNVSRFGVHNLLGGYTGISLALAPLITYLEVPLLSIASHIDLLLFPIMLIQSLIHGSFYGLIIFFFIWCLRVEYSAASRQSIYTMLNLVTRILSQPNIPPHVFQNWLFVRRNIETMIPSFKGGMLQDPVMVPRHRGRHRRKMNRMLREPVFNDNSSIIFR